MLFRSLFTQFAFQRRQRVEYDETKNSAMFISPEDIVLAKLMAFKETGSDKHLRDARGVLIARWGNLNLNAIRRGAQGADVIKQFEEILESARKELNQ